MRNGRTWHRCTERPHEPIFFSFSDLSFIMGKTTTKTEVEVPVAGTEPAAKRATGEPGIVPPIAPTNFEANSF